MLKIKLFLLVTFFLFTGVLQAQWQPDVRLTNNPADSWTSYNNARCIAASGNDLHVVWYDIRDGNREIYYKRSTTGGLSWSADTRLTNNFSNSSNPSVSVSGSMLHVVWNDNRDGNYEIYYKRSTDGGISWGADTRLTNHTSDSFTPSLSITGQVIHVVWHENRDGVNNPEIYYKHSTDGGNSWGIDLRLTSAPLNSLSPSISVSGSAVHVVWFDDRDGNSEIYYKRSTNGGINWDPDVRLTNNPAYSFHPSVSVSGAVIHVVWNDEREENSKIYYKRSTDLGVSWGQDTRLTNDPGYSGFPSLASSLQNVHAAWYDFRGGTQIFYKRSTDGGLSWSEDTQLSNNTSGGTYTPFIAISGSAVHVVWQDYRDGNSEIYYKRNPTGNPIGIQPISNEIPYQFSLSQNYPNPFNPSTIIRFNIKDPGFTTLKVFDILGRDVASLVNEELKPGSYEVGWNASNYPSSVYYYRIAIHSDKLTAEIYTETKKMVLIK